MSDAGAPEGPGDENSLRDTRAGDYHARSVRRIPSDALYGRLVNTDRRWRDRLTVQASRLVTPRIPDRFRARLRGQDLFLSERAVSRDGGVSSPRSNRHSRSDRLGVCLPFIKGRLQPRRQPLSVGASVNRQSTEAPAPTFGQIDVVLIAGLIARAAVAWYDVSGMSMIGGIFPMLAIAIAIM